MVLQYGFDCPVGPCRRVAAKGKALWVLILATHQAVDGVTFT